jgi:hypothetical protein
MASRDDRQRLEKKAAGETSSWGRNAPLSQDRDIFRDKKSNSSETVAVRKLDIENQIKMLFEAPVLANSKVSAATRLYPIKNGFKDEL